MRNFLFALSVLISSALYGQSIIRGTVIDSLTQAPLVSATVYVNGSTLGTTTADDGRFELRDVSFPATVIFSFVGYEPYALALTRDPGDLTVTLRPNSELPEIVISGKANKVKKKDLEEFKKMFLGDDRWGKNAIIKNENALVVDKSEEVSYFIRPISSSSFYTPYINSSYVVEKHVLSNDTVRQVRNVTTAWATEPLIIDMPLLGYVLYVDLVRFTVIQVNNLESCNILGYFYYKPYENVSKRDAASIESNRKKAYYGSSQHFLRSLSENRLAENGYIMTTPEEIKKGKKTITMHLPVEVQEHSAVTDDNMVQVYGLKNKNVKVKYYHGNYGIPTDLKGKQPGLHLYSESGMSLLRDTCVYTREGIVIDNSIRFTGNLSKKRVGASLPDDYYPSVDTTRISVKDPEDKSGGMADFVDNIHKFNCLFPQEKVYLEFDNTAYFQGENIWFKAFVTNATTLESAPSGVLYVDFLAPTGQLIQQQKLKIEDGQADGSIPLLDMSTQQARMLRGVVGYPSGFYEIRAYTQNMLNFSHDAVFSRVIPVYTQPKFVGDYSRSHVETDQVNKMVEDIRKESGEKEKKKSVYEPNVDVSFYPEGGDLIIGLPCRVAFKITGRDGFGMDVSLKIPGIGDSVYTVHDGMGSFIFTPGESETIRFATYGRNRLIFNMPKAVESGYSMISDMRSDSLLEVNIWRTPDRVGEQTALAVTCRGEVVYYKEIKDLENSYLKIDCSNWPIGVCRMTLFNKDGMILSSRSIFHNNTELLSPALTVNTDSLSNIQFGREVLELKLTDESGNPLRDSFCLSVRDARDYGTGRTENLQTNLLLSSDLRGYIHDPAWYLESSDSLHREALNLLTLVQGWERYEWQPMTGQTEFEEKHRIEEGLTMNGWILSFGKRDPVSDISVYAALTPDEDKTLFESYDYRTDSTGYFGFDMSDFYGKGAFTVHLMSTNRKGEPQYKKFKRIRLERADKPKLRPFYKQETDLSHNTPGEDDYEVDFTNDGLTSEQLKKLGIIINDVDIDEEVDKIRFIDYDTFTAFDTDLDTEMELDEGEYSGTLRDYLRERGIDDYSVEEVGENGERTRTSLLGGSYYKPYYYIHDSKSYISNLVDDYYLVDVKSIVIYDKPKYLRDFLDLIPLEVKAKEGSDWYYWAKNSYEKYYLVDIQLKEENEMLFTWEIINLSRRSTTVKGFTKPVEFYSPEYPDGPIEGEIDPRRTLYWNPNVITDEDGRARVEFYNNNFTHKFTIRGAGVTESGVPYILNQNYPVSK